MKLEFLTLTNICASSRGNTKKVSISQQKGVKDSQVKKEKNPFNKKGKKRKKIKKMKKRIIKVLLK